MIGDIHQMLLMWARWVREREPQGHCYSIEHRYSRKSRADDTPTGWGDWLTSPPSQHLPPIDVLQAVEVERIMHIVPKRQRKLLKLRYVLGMDEKMVRLRLSIARDEWAETLEDAHVVVRNLLTQNANRRIQPPDYRFRLRPSPFAHQAGAVRSQESVGA